MTLRAFKGAFKVLLRSFQCAFNVSFLEGLLEACTDELLGYHCPHTLDVLVHFTVEFDVNNLLKQQLKRRSL